MSNHAQNPFDHLADRGTPRGADAVLDAAMARAAASLDAARKDTVMSNDLTPIEPDDISVVDMEPKRPRASRRQRGVAGLGIAALLGVGGYAAYSVQGDGGGADSPQAAVEQLADALENEDALAAIDVMSPREVRSLKDAVKRASDKAEQFDLVRDKADPFAGFDVDVEGLETEVETLAPGFAKVTITGGVIRGQIDPDGLASRFSDVEPGEPAEVDLTELRSGGSDDFAESATTMALPDDTIADAGGESFVGRTPMPAQVIGDQAPPVFVIAIEDNGGWYLSPAYTAFEYAREAYEGDGNDAVNVELGSAVASQLGATDPETAVRDAFAAIEASDWERLTELAPPSELPVWEYRELLLAASGGDAQSDLTVDSLDVRVEVDGDRATAFIEAKLQSDGNSWQLGGECAGAGFVSFSDGEEPAEYCISGRAGGAVPALLLLGGDTTDAGPLEVQLVREGGQWFVSPVGTVVDFIDGFIDAFDAEMLAMFTGDYTDVESQGTLEYGVAVELANGEPVVYDVAVAAGDQLVAQYEGSVSITLIDPEGMRMDDSYELSYGSGLLVDEAGTYRVALVAYDGGTFTLYGDGLIDIAPRGELTLGAEITANASPTVFTFEASAGQQIVGRVGSADVSLLDANGNDLDAYGLGYGEVVTITEAGTYRIVVRPYSGSATFTIWDRADAPEGVEGGFAAPGFEEDVASSECTTEGSVTTCISYDVDGNVVEEYSYDDLATETTTGITVDAPVTTVAA